MNQDIIDNIISSDYQQARKAYNIKYCIITCSVFVHYQSLTTFVVSAEPSM